MLRILLIALLAAPGAMAAEAPAAERLLTLAPRGADPGTQCTADATWCVQLGEPAGDSSPPPVLRPGSQARAARAPDDTFAIWPALVTLRDGGFLAGVEVRSSTGYSGGGGSATELQLFHLSPRGEADAKPVLTVPIAGSLMIRACFSERDMRRRRGACHDEYGFSATLTLAPGGTAARPGLVYATKAWAYPRGASRMQDSNEMPPLRQADLVRRRDTTCSFTRRMVFSAAAGEYRPDRPLPDCSDYTVP